MNVQVFINGQDKTTSLISYNRNHNICTGIGAGTFVFKAGITGILPYSSIVLYEESVKKATYFVASIVNSVSAGGRTITLEVQDGTKMMADYFVDEILYVQNTVYMASDRIAHYLDLAKVTYVFDTYEGDSTLDGDSTWGPASCMELVTQLMQQCGWYLYFDAENVCHINHMGYISAANTILDGHTLSYASNKNDTMVRNRAVIYGKYTSGGYITAEAQTTTDYDIDAGDVKTVVLANHNIGSSSKANELANMLITEFGRTSETRTVILTGAGDYTIGQAVTLDLTVAQADCLVTDVKVSMNSSGLTTTLTLDERCPRLFAFLDGIFTPDPLPVGSGWVQSLVLFSGCDLVRMNSDACVWVNEIRDCTGIELPTYDNPTTLPSLVGKKVFYFAPPTTVAREVLNSAYGDVDTGPYYSIGYSDTVKITHTDSYLGTHDNYYGSEYQASHFLVNIPCPISEIYGKSLTIEYIYTGESISFYYSEEPFGDLDLDFYSTEREVYKDGVLLDPYETEIITFSPGTKIKIKYNNIKGVPVEYLQGIIDSFEYQWNCTLGNRLPVYVYTRQLHVKVDSLDKIQFLFDNSGYNIYHGSQATWVNQGTGTDLPFDLRSFWYRFNPGFITLIEKDPDGYVGPWENPNDDSVWKLEFFLNPPDSLIVDWRCESIGNYSPLLGGNNYIQWYPGFYTNNRGTDGHDDGSIILVSTDEFPEYWESDTIYYPGVVPNYSPTPGPQLIRHYSNHPYWNYENYRIYAASFSYFAYKDAFPEATTMMHSFSFVQLYVDDPEDKIRYRIQL